MSGILGQVLGSIFSNATGRPGGAAPGGLDALGGSLGGLGGAGLGGILGGMLGGQQRGERGGGGGGGMGSHGALLAMLLPLALQWMQRNGGLNGVLEKFGQRGYSGQTRSWIGTGSNENVSPDAVGEVMGADEIDAIAMQLGVQPGEVTQGMSELLPEVANQMTPEGRIPEDHGSTLDQALQALSQMTRRG